MKVNWLLWLPRNMRLSVQILVIWTSYCYFLSLSAYPENTHLLRKGKYHCTTDLLTVWIQLLCLCWITNGFTYLFDKFQTSQTVGQTYSDTSFCGECSLAFDFLRNVVFSVAAVTGMWTPAFKARFTMCFICGWLPTITLVHLGGFEPTVQEIFISKVNTPIPVWTHLLWRSSLPTNVP